MFATPPPVRQAARQYELRGELPMGVLSTPDAGAYIRLLPGCFRGSCDQLLPIWYGHNRPAGCYGTLQVTGGLSELLAELDEDRSPALATAGICADRAGIRFQPWR